MTEIVKTKAEKAFITQFGTARPRLPGSGWVATLREDAMSSFDKLGLPHRRIEEWKYTDLRERISEIGTPAEAPVSMPELSQVTAALGALATIDAFRVVFVDGHYAPQLSDGDALGAVSEVIPLGRMLAKAPPWLQSKFTTARLGSGDPVAALNLGFMTDGVLLKIRAGTEAGKPVLLVFARSAGSDAAITTRNIVSVEADAKLTLIETHVSLGGKAGAGLGNYATDFDIANGADVTHVKCTGSADAVHLGGWRLRIGENAQYRGFQLTAGAPLARNDIVVGFTGAASKFDLSGVFLGRDRNHIDTTLFVDHSTPGCESRELFKGVLDGRARGVFQGKIVVQPIAQKTDGKQMAQVLMLSPDAEFDSKPELEIYADDVACGHGSTAAEIDPDLLFYLRSRGIPKDEARALLIESFIGEALDKIGHETVREALRAEALAWLAAGSRTAGHNGGTS